MFSIAHFNSHTREGVTNIIGRPILKKIFQLTHPWGCDAKFGVTQEQIEISTHTPVRVWRRKAAPPVPVQHFNSHTREGVTSRFRLTIYPSKISTHTPVRVWPNTFSLPHHEKGISTHTPVRVWLQCFYYKQDRFFISTHTPVRVWLSALLPRSSAPKFQLTHPWGCDKGKKAQEAARQNFNSHTREGVTVIGHLLSWKS